MKVVTTATEEVFVGTRDRRGAVLTHEDNGMIFRSCFSIDVVNEQNDNTVQDEALARDVLSCRCLQESTLMSAWADLRFTDYGIYPRRKHEWHRVLIELRGNRLLCFALESSSLPGGVFSLQKSKSYCTHHRNLKTVSLYSELVFAISVDEFAIWTPTEARSNGNPKRYWCIQAIPSWERVLYFRADRVAQATHIVKSIQRFQTMFSEKNFEDELELRDCEWRAGPTPAVLRSGFPIARLVRTQLRKDPCDKKLHMAYAVLVVYNGMEWRLWKRFSDFQSLHDELHRLRSNLSVGPQHRYPWCRDRSGFLELRRMKLSRFLTDVTTDPNLALSLPLLQFIGAVHPVRNCKAGSPCNSISVDLLDAILDVGDLILVKSNHFWGASQRVVTGSSWDHVAIVCRIPYNSNRPSSLSLFEATQEGINIYPLINRLQAYRDWKVCFRKLEWRPGKDSLEALDRFIDAARGCKFSLLGLIYNPKRRLHARDDIEVSHSRLSKHHSIVSRSSSQDSMIFSSSSQSRLSTSEASIDIAAVTLDDSHPAASAFFCSELVASAYQALGLIALERRAGSFLPVHFTEAGSSKLNLPSYARLSDETPINFRKSDISFLKPHVRRVHSSDALKTALKSAYLL